MIANRVQNLESIELFHGDSELRKHFARARMHRKHDLQLVREARQFGDDTVQILFVIDIRWTMERYVNKGFPIKAEFLKRAVLAGFFDILDKRTTAILPTSLFSHLAPRG
jgi:hypothetical protein